MFSTCEIIINPSCYCRPAETPEKPPTTWPSFQSPRRLSSLFDLQRAPAHTNYHTAFETLQVQMSNREWSVLYSGFTPGVGLKSDCSTKMENWQPNPPIQILDAFMRPGLKCRPRR